MKFDKNSFIAIVMCVIGFFAYETYLNKKYPDRHKVHQEAPVPSHEKKDEISEAHAPALPASQGSVQATTTAMVSEQTYPQLDKKDLTLENESSIYLFNQTHGGIDSAHLKHYMNEAKDAPINILEHPVVIYPSLTQEILPHPGFKAERKGDSLEFTRKKGAWLLTHKYTIPKSGYGLSIEMSWTNEGGSKDPLKTYVVMKKTVDFVEAKTGFFSGGLPKAHPTVVTGTDQSYEWSDIQEHCKDATKSSLMSSLTNQHIKLFGFDKNYFLVAFLPDIKKLSTEIIRTPDPMGKSCSVAILASNDYGSLSQGGSVALAFKSWFGPKDTSLMDLYDDKLQYAIDLGFVGTLARALLSSLRYVYNGVHNWGLAIILFTMLLKLLFYPLVRRATVSMKKVQKLKPEMDRIRETYKDDPRRQQQEIMKFMGAHKINPLKGCLPILPQLPVFFAFWRALSSSVELRHAPFGGWIHDLSAADPYFILPLVLGVLMFVQQKLTPTAGVDKMQEKMMLFFPVFLTFLSLTFPSGLVVYMLTNTIISILQQQWLNKRVIV